ALNNICSAELGGVEVAGRMPDDLSSRRLPTINPGQIWVVEQDAASALSALDREALINANAVIYDRALAPLVAQILPMGAYAEPLSDAAPAAGPAPSPRAPDAAGGGWRGARPAGARPGRAAG